MKRRYYFDTSVFGGVFDEEFRYYSIQLFEEVKRGRVLCLYSEVVIAELLNAPPKVVQFSTISAKNTSNTLISDLLQKHLRALT